MFVKIKQNRKIVATVKNRVPSFFEYSMPMVCNEINEVSFVKYYFKGLETIKTVLDLKSSNFTVTNTKIMPFSKKPYSDKKQNAGLCT